MLCDVFEEVRPKKVPLMREEGVQSSWTILTKWLAMEASFDCNRDNKCWYWSFVKVTCSFVEATGSIEVRLVDEKLRELCLPYSLCQGDSHGVYSIFLAKYNVLSNDSECKWGVVHCLLWSSFLGYDLGSWNVCKKVCHVFVKEVVYMKVCIGYMAT